MDTELLKHVANKLNAEIEHLKEDAILGKAKDYGDYKWACGIVRGLMMANSIIADTVQRVENDDE